MHRPSVAINVSPSGKVKVLYAGLEAADALAAYKDCEEAGKSVCVLNVQPDRSKSIPAKPEAKGTSGRRPVK